MLWATALLLALGTPAAGRWSDTRDSPDTQRLIEQELTGLGTRRLRVEHSFGHCRVLALEKDGVPRLALQLGASGDRPEVEAAFLERVGVAVRAEGESALHLISQFPPADDKPETVSFSADLTLWLPLGTALTVQNKYGAVEVLTRRADVEIGNRLGPISVQDVTGRVDLSTHFDKVSARQVTGELIIAGSSATVEVADVEGPVTVRNTFGEITLEDVRGDVEVENRNQPITLRAIRGSARLIAPHCEVRAEDIERDLHVESSNKTLVIHDVGGDLEVHHKYASIEVMRVGGEARISGHLTPVVFEGGGGRTEIRCTSSSVRVRAVDAELIVETTSGAIDLAEIAGDVTATGRSGLLRATLPVLPADAAPQWTLENHRSPIELRLPAGASCRVEARSLGASIESEHPGLKIERSGSITLGTLVLGAGAVRIDATCVEASVQIKRPESP